MELKRPWYKSWKRVAGIMILSATIIYASLIAVFRNYPTPWLKISVGPETKIIKNNLELTFIPEVVVQNSSSSVKFHFKLVNVGSEDYTFSDDHFYAALYPISGESPIYYIQSSMYAEKTFILTLHPGEVYSGAFTWNWLSTWGYDLILPGHYYVSGIWKEKSLLMETPTTSLYLDIF